MILWAGGVRGPLVTPGSYEVRLTVAGKSFTQKFEVRKDPRLKTSPEEFAAQLELELQVRNKLSQTNQGVIDVREVRKQIGELTDRLKAPENGKSESGYRSGESSLR